MAMLRHPLSNTEYHLLGDGTVRVVGKDGVEGVFNRQGVWISGPRRTADPALCQWIADSSFGGTLKKNPVTLSVGARSSEEKDSK